MIEPLSLVSDYTVNSNKLTTCIINNHSVTLKR